MSEDEFAEICRKIKGHTKFIYLHVIGELFYIHLSLVNFPDKHCICGHKYKNTAYFERAMPYF